jgi:AcrR family transcriptional regulator
MAGLRARKKERVRTTIQKEALRLFTEQGFDRTTVEQIADAAGVSVATFYRYYTSKEDSVVTDEYDPIVVQSIMERPADEPLIDAVRAVMGSVMVKYLARDRDLLVARQALRRSTPELQAAFSEEQERALRLFSSLIARHLRRSADDRDVQIACGALTGALQAAFTTWLAQGGKGGEQRVREVLEHAIDRVESALRF